MSRYRLKISPNPDTDHEVNRLFYHPQYKMFGLIWVYFDIWQDIDGSYDVEYGLNPITDIWSEKYATEKCKKHKEGYRSVFSNKYKYV